MAGRRDLTDTKKRDSYGLTCYKKKPDGIVILSFWCILIYLRNVSRSSKFPLIPPSNFPFLLPSIKRQETIWGRLRGVGGSEMWWRGWMPPLQPRGSGGGPNARRARVNPTAG